jgi:hypothetical protein
MKKLFLLLVVFLAAATAYCGVTVVFISPESSVPADPIYGVVWHQDTDTYTIGTVTGTTFAETTVSEWPIQEAMKRVILQDNGTINYELNSTDSYNRSGVSPSVSGTDDAGTASKVSDAGVFTSAESAYKGRYCHNTTDDTYSMITAKDSDNVLSLQEDIMDSGEGFEICTAVLDGTDGQVMVQIPKFYYVQEQDGADRWFLISESDFTVTINSSPVGAEIFPAFYKGGSATASDYRYIGAYEATMYDDSNSAMTAVGSIHTSLYASGDIMCSVSGQYPKTAETRAEYRAMAEERGSGWHQFGGYDQAMLSILFVTEYGSLRTQQELGNGRVSLSSGSWIAGENGAGGYIGQCGYSNSDGNASGHQSNGGSISGSQSSDYMSYRGIENWWGNVWKFIDGCNVHNSTENGSRLYLSADYTAFDDDTDTYYTLIGSLAETDGYPNDIVDGVGAWPFSIGGSSSTYLADYYTTYFDIDADSGWRVARVGGDAATGSTAGAFYFYSYRDLSFAIGYIGGRLCY